MHPLSALFKPVTRLLRRCLQQSTLLRSLASAGWGSVACPPRSQLMQSSLHRRLAVASVGLLTVLSLALPGTVNAGEVVYKKHTVVDFGDDTVEGDLSKPDGQYLESRKRFRHQRLIKVRENFRPEILQSISNL
jgi:hypothetical protein